MESSQQKTSDPTILEAQADFALNLLRELFKEDSSIVLSPISVAIALSMVYAGAKEKTGQEIGQLLAKEASESKVHEFFGDLISAIQNGQKQYTLEVANKVYVKSGFSVLDTFKTAIDRHYGGQFESVEFGQKEATAKKINQFVERATHDKIHDLIKSEMLDVLTRLVLINAVYFKGNWADKFDPKRTEKKPFYISEGNKKELDMMRKKDDFIYYENEQLQMLGMPYVGEEVFMFVLLPKERFGLDKLLANLTGKALLELVQNRRKKEVDVILPKFKLESTHDLNGPLQKLGMASAFSDAANFGGITATEPLKISQVIQKAFIEVNEEGTEAAAATAAVFMCKSLPLPPPKFCADQPFAIFLMSKQCNVFFNGIFRN